MAEPIVDRWFKILSKAEGDATNVTVHMLNTSFFGRVVFLDDQIVTIRKYGYDFSNHIDLTKIESVTVHA